MVSEQPTRKVIKSLKDAGWSSGRTVGSHTMWVGPNGTQFPLPDGHKTISPGVYRNLLKAIADDESK